MEEATENGSQQAEAAPVEYELTVTEDKMTVYLSCSAEFAASTQSMDRIQVRLKQMNVTAEPDMLLLEEALNEARSANEGITNLPVVAGKPPVMPMDAKLEWTEDYFKEGYYIDPETKRIDFHQKIENPSVDEGQLLVKVHSPIPGKDGKDVYGKTITVPKPKQITLRGGPNVCWDGEVGGYRARSSGRVTLVSQTLNVDQVFTVKHGVGTESGNVQHNGHVVVNGDVDSDFKVEATGDIEIRGITYASDILAGGDVTAKEGIIGKSSNKIKAGRNIYAKYVQNAVLESGENTVVNREIVQSIVISKGEIHCCEGRVIGSELWGTRGITVGEAGSKEGATTLLVAGVDPELQAALRANSVEVTRIKEAIKKLEQGYRRLNQNLRLLTAAQRESMTTIQFKIVEGQEELENLDSQKKDLLDKIRQSHSVQVKILKIAYPGLIIRICDSQYQVKHTLAGPFIAHFDKLKNEVALMSEIEEKEEVTNEG
ncbi:MAG: FapA family protein [Candidatus Zixiibacteriota bacterium]